jgi:glycosyltransferase involved in cell wall biosynthesis
MEKPFFTVFTPTYNRAHLIGRVYDSLCAQDFSSFEWLVIDDGSEDETDTLVKKWKSEAAFPIRYLRRENRGKARSINEAIELARGFFFLVFDSDDWCDPDAFRVLHHTWQAVPERMKPDYAAISCLKRYRNGEIVGDDYSEIQGYGKSYIDRLNMALCGDKWECVRLDVHRCYSYPVHPDDKYMAPSYVWNMIGLTFRTVFINKPLATIEYQSDGISNNNIKHRVANSSTTWKYYHDMADLKGLTLGVYLRLVLNEARFRAHNRQFPVRFRHYVFFVFGLAFKWLDKFYLKVKV